MGGSDSGAIWPPNGDFVHQNDVHKTERVTCARKVVISLSVISIWVFPKIGVPENGWFIMENPIKMG